MARGEFSLDTVVRVYGVTGDDPNGTPGEDIDGNYREYATITAPEIHHALIESAISIGNCISGTLNFTLMTTDTLPKAAKIKVRSRVKSTDSDPVYAEWMDFGTFWIDHRTINENLIDLECYDAMKKGNQAYSDNSQVLSWPKTIATVVTRIAQQMNVSIDSRTQSAIINSDIGALNIITKPNDDEVLLDVLSHIGGIIGGNWCITPDNALRFIPLVSPPAATNYLLDSDYERITTDSGDFLLISGEPGEHVEEDHPAGGGRLNVPVVIGGIDTASTRVVSRVTVTTVSGDVYTYGDDTGIEIAVEDSPYATASLVQALYNRLVGIEYAPFEMTGCVYNPAAELGDWIVAGDKVRSVLYIETARLDIGFFSDCSAPGEDEMEDEYPYQSAIKRTNYRVSTIRSELHSEIQQTQDSILATVEETYARNNVFNTTLEDDVIYYLASDFDSGITIDTPGWSTTLPTLTEYNSYLWVYRVLTYADEETRTIEPFILFDYYFDGGECTGVVRLYYASNIGTAPEAPTADVHNSSTDPLAWTISIPDVSEEYPYLFYCYELHSANNDTAWTEPERDTVTMYDIDGFMRQTSLELTQFGFELSSVEQNYTQNTEVRSRFALDPTNITLEAGVDEHDNPTGRITFNAGTLIVNSTNFTLTDAGFLTCYGANINGDFKAIYEPSAEITEYGEQSFAIKLDKYGFGFYSDDVTTGLIHEDIEVLLPEEEGDDPEIVDHGLVIETSGGRELRLSGSAITLDTYALKMRGQTGFTGSVMVGNPYQSGSVTLSFENGMLYAAQ